MFLLEVKDFGKLPGISKILSLIQFTTYTCILCIAGAYFISSTFLKSRVKFILLLRVSCYKLVGDINPLSCVLLERTSLFIIIILY
jgi:hypothetical protein